MSIDALKSALPDYAKDLKLNLSNVLATPGLTEQQIWGTALASALASRNATVIKAVDAEAAQHLSAEGQNAAKAAAAIMGMNNIYYRFVHLTSQRSEEQTSELQSLMRISYAVLCLKKKKLYP